MTVGSTTLVANTCTYSIQNTAPCLQNKNKFISEQNKKLFQ